MKLPRRFHATHPYAYCVRPECPWISTPLIGRAAVEQEGTAHAQDSGHRVRAVLAQEEVLLGPAHDNDITRENA